MELIDTLIERNTGGALSYERDEGTGARSKFWGTCQGRGTGVGVTTVSNSLILGRWATKVFENGDEERGGWKGG